MRASFVVILITVFAIAESAICQAASRHPPHIAGGANGSWTMASGEDFETTDDGPGLDAHIGIPVSRWASFDVGMQYSHHKLSTHRQGDASLYVVYVEPRMRMSRSLGGAFPFLGVRVGWVRRDVSQEGWGESDTDGYVLGGTGGAMFHLTGPVWLEAAASVSSTWLEPMVARTSDRDRTRGTLVAIEFGVRVPFGRPGG